MFAVVVKCITIRMFFPGISCLLFLNTFVSWSYVILLLLLFSFNDYGIQDGRPMTEPHGMLSNKGLNLRFTPLLMAKL